MSSLDTAYDAKRRRKFWVQWPLALLLTIVVAVMIAAVLLLLPIGSAVEGWMARNHFRRPMLMLFDGSRMVLSVLLVLAFLSIVYQYGTVVRHPFAFVSPGAVFTMVVWFALGTGFRIYIDRFGSYQKTYGTLGGVAILLLFFYLDALVLLVGAEINSQVDECMAADKQPALFPPDVMGE